GSRTVIDGCGSFLQRPLAASASLLAVFLSGAPPANAKRETDSDEHFGLGLMRFAGGAPRCVIGRECFRPGGPQPREHGRRLIRALCPSCGKRKHVSSA